MLHRNSSQWSDVWVRGDDNSSERLEKHPVREQLKMRKVTRSDEGMYKVLDDHGLAVSTVQLAVEGERLQIHSFTPAGLRERPVTLSQLQNADTNSFYQLFSSTGSALTDKFFTTHRKTHSSQSPQASGKPSGSR